MPKPVFIRIILIFCVLWDLRLEKSRIHGDNVDVCKPFDPDIEPCTTLLECQAWKTEKLSRCRTKENKSISQGCGTGIAHTIVSCPQPFRCNPVLKPAEQEECTDLTHSNAAWN